ncbi:MAG: flagellar biosynthetic protein FliR [Candidatus Gastranaerophilales bacterium]|nr:flagellar biosynthetic protein FliR [Candidatus Gastranaerophilales bacterium]
MMTDLLLMLSPTNIVIFVLVMTRLSGMFVSAPFFSTLPIPTQTKAVLVLSIAFMMYPFVAAHTGVLTTGLLDIPSLVILMLKEFVVGATIGFCAGLIFSGIQLAGQLLSIQMGLAISEILDPVTQQNVPILGQFYLFIASLTFIFINGHIWLFESIYKSYNVIPVNYNFIFSGQLVETIIYFVSQIFQIAFSIIMPIYAILIITATVLGFMSKAMPQMNVFMVALPLKIYIGIALMIAFAIPTSTYIASLMQTLLQNISTMFS